MALDHGPRGMAALQALYHVLTKPILGAAPSTVSVTAGRSQPRRSSDCR